MDFPIINMVLSITYNMIFSSPGHCPGWTVIGNSVCLSVCPFTPVAQLTDKMDPCAKHQNYSPGSHNDAHKNNPKNPPKNEDNLPTNPVVRKGADPSVKVRD